MYYKLLLMGLLAALAMPVMAGDDSWVQGRWEQSFDPDGSPKDYLEFLPNGDVYTIAANGERTNGMYVVTEDRVTSVFSRKGKDVIATFFFDAQHQELRIVTSRTGKETLYHKLPINSPAP